jgi:hypothetical protein
LYSSRLGSAIHKGIALAIQAGIGPEDVDGILAFSKAMLAGERFKSRRTVILLSSRIQLFLREYLPPAPWYLDAAEKDVNGGRIDLCWRLDGLRPAVLYDELKTSSLRWVTRDRSAIDQAHRYDAAGIVAHGDAFVGTRVVALGVPRGVWLTDRARHAVARHPWLEASR